MATKRIVQKICSTCDNRISIGLWSAQMELYTKYLLTKSQWITKSNEKSTSSNCSPTLWYIYSFHFRHRLKATHFARSLTHSRSGVSFNCRISRLTQQIFVSAHFCFMYSFIYINRKSEEERERESSSSNRSNSSST